MITLKCGTEEQHRRGLLQICQDVHMTLLGTYERNYETGQEDMAADIQYLRDVVSGWEDPNPSTDGKVSPFLEVSQDATAAYDRAVLGLVVATLAEVVDYVAREQTNARRSVRSFLNAQRPVGPQPETIREGREPCFYCEGPQFEGKICDRCGRVA